MNQFKEKALSKLSTSRNPNSSLFTEFRQLMIRPLCKTITSKRLGNMIDGSAFPTTLVTREVNKTMLFILNIEKK